MSFASSEVTPALSVLVLAGGQSSRMGQDKALLVWQGMSLLRRVCELAQEMTSDVQVLSPWPDRYQSVLPQGMMSLQEVAMGRGPLSALAQGLAQIQAEWVLLLACDMPLLEVARLQEWRSHLHQLPKSCLAYVPQTQTAHKLRWEPLCGFYRRASLESLTSFLEQGGQSFQRWLCEIEARPIALTAKDASMFFNCNTPDDWGRLEKQRHPSPFT